MSDNRDTQFAGFARKLHKRVRSAIMQLAIDQRGPDEIIRAQEEIVARAAYELVRHAVSETTGSTNIDHVPDLTTWPKETEKP